MAGGHGYTKMIHLIKSLVSFLFSETRSNIKSHHSRHYKNNSQNRKIFQLSACEKKFLQTFYSKNSSSLTPDKLKIIWINEKELFSACLSRAMAASEPCWCINMWMHSHVIHAAVYQRNSCALFSFVLFTVQAPVRWDWCVDC